MCISPLFIAITHYSIDDHSLPESEPCKLISVWIVLHASVILIAIDDVIYSPDLNREKGRPKREKWAITCIHNTLQFCGPNYSSFRLLTLNDKVLDGLQSGQGPLLHTGRGVLAGEYIPKHTFICKYKTWRILRRDEAAAEEKRHQFNQMGCYMVDVQYPLPGHGRVTLDTTEWMLNNPGRYINHV